MLMVGSWGLWTSWSPWARLPWYFCWPFWNRKQTNSSIYIYMGVSKNNGTPKSSMFNRIFHHKSSILGYPYFWKPPYLWSKDNHFALSSQCSLKGCIRETQINTQQIRNGHWFWGIFWFLRLLSPPQSRRKTHRNKHSEHLQLLTADWESLVFSQQGPVTRYLWKV